MRARPRGCLHCLLYLSFCLSFYCLAVWLGPWAKCTTGDWPRSGALRQAMCGAKPLPYHSAGSVTRTTASNRPCRRTACRARWASRPLRMVERSKARSPDVSRQAQNIPTPPRGFRMLSCRERLAAAKRLQSSPWLYPQPGSQVPDLLVVADRLVADARCLPVRIVFVGHPG